MSVVKRDSNNQIAFADISKLKLTKLVPAAEDGTGRNTLWASNSLDDYSILLNIGGNVGIGGVDDRLGVMIHIIVNHPYPTRLLGDNGEYSTSNLFAGGGFEDLYAEQFHMFLQVGDKAWKLSCSPHLISVPTGGSYLWTERVNVADVDRLESGDPSDNNSFWNSTGIATFLGSPSVDAFSVPDSSRTYVPGRVYQYLFPFEELSFFDVSYDDAVTSDEFITNPYVGETATSLMSVLLSDDAEVSIFSFGNNDNLAPVIPSARQHQNDDDSQEVYFEGVPRLVTAPRSELADNIFVGLTEAGEIDIDLTKSYGLSSVELSDDSDEINEEFNRWVISLEAACRKWEKRTGREYGRTKTETRSFQVRRPTRELYIGLAQEVESVVYTYGRTEGEPVENWDALQLNPRDTVSVDTIVSSNGGYFRPGRYEVEAIWGISASEIPKDVERAVLRYASALHQQAQSPNSYLPPDDYGDYPHLIPYDVWEAIERHKLSDTVFPIVM